MRDAFVGAAAETGMVPVGAGTKNIVSVAAFGFAAGYGCVDVLVRVVLAVAFAAPVPGDAMVPPGRETVVQDSLYELVAGIAAGSTQVKGQCPSNRLDPVSIVPLLAIWTGTIHRIFFISGRLDRSAATPQKSNRTRILSGVDHRFSPVGNL